MLTEQTHTPVQPRHHAAESTKDLLKHGALAGLAGGLVMALTGMVIAATAEGMWMPLKAVAGAWLPAAAIQQPGFDATAVLLGTLTHLLMSVVLGCLFALLYGRVLDLPVNLGLPYLAGGIYGFFIWSVAYIYLPRVNPVLASMDQPTFLLAHIAYGVVLGLAFRALSLPGHAELADVED